MTNLYPESMYFFDPTKVSRKKVVEAFQQGKAVTGFVESFDAKFSGSFKVNLGDGLIGILPISDASIYPLYRNNGSTSGEFNNLIGRTIRARVLFIDENGNDPYVYLSREQNMMETFDYFVSNHIDEVSAATIVGLAEKSAFVDIGQGVVGRISPQEFSQCFYDSIYDVGLKKGDSFPVKILNFDKETFKVELSRLACLPSAEKVLIPGKVYVAQVFHPVINSAKYSYGYYGYFVSINTYLRGIVDSPIPLCYGDSIFVRLKAFGTKGPKFRFVGFE